MPGACNMKGSIRFAFFLEQVFVFLLLSSFGVKHRCPFPNLKLSPSTAGHRVDERTRLPGRAELAFSPAKPKANTWRRETRQQKYSPPELS